MLYFLYFVAGVFARRIWSAQRQSIIHPATPHKTRVYSEIDTPPGLFPVTVSSGVRPVTTTNFLRRRLIGGPRRVMIAGSVDGSLLALGFGVVAHIFGIELTHRESMPEAVFDCMSGHGCTLIQSDLMPNTSYSCIVVRGDDAFEFLQGQLTNDLQLLSHDADDNDSQQQDRRESIVSAWCNPKGRVICLFRVRRIEDRFEMTLPAELADAMVKRLQMYRFRAKVEFEIQPGDLQAIGISGPETEWRRQNLLAGIPEVWQAQSELFTPHMLNLDLLQAVNLDKGCYPGQEIVARTHYRGASKRRLLRFESTEPVFPGDKVYDGEQKVGNVVNAIGNDLLAVVPLDKADSHLTIGGNDLTPRGLPYLS